MEVPASLQQATPFGVNLGGSNTAFYAVMPDCEFDSWLTVGPTDGSDNGAISAIGVEWDAWDETTAMSVDNGAVFWMNPDDGPGKGAAGADHADYDAVLAQLTMADGTSGAMRFDAQGNSAGKGAHDWEEHCIEVMVGGPSSGAGSHSANGVPMPAGSGMVRPAPAAGGPKYDADCPFTSDGTCDEGSGKGAKCPAGTDTTDCLGAECLSVDTDLINGACAPDGQTLANGVPTKCTAACAVVYGSWWRRCSPAKELQIADDQLGGQLSGFARTCENAVGGGH